LVFSLLRRIFASKIDYFMRKVIGIGETVLDIIFQGDQPVSAVPGGSTFNALISLGRSGVPATFISETGNDRVGRRIISFLEENHVDTSNVNVYPESKSPLSLAFLNEQNDAEYLFYKDHPRDRLDFSYPEVNKDDIVLFGSYYALNPVIRPQVLAFLQYAHQRGAILYYDVNFRASHQHEVMKLTANFLENLELADIVRGSHEDFNILFRMTDADTIYRTHVSFYCKKFICTCGREPLVVRAEDGFRKEYAVTPTDVVSTIGAGDNFNAGFVFGLLKQGITSSMVTDGLTEEQWDRLINSAQLFSAECCRSINNSVSPEFGKQMQGL